MIMLLWSSDDSAASGQLYLYREVGCSPTLRRVDTGAPLIVELPWVQYLPDAPIIFQRVVERIRRQNADAMLGMQWWIETIEPSDLPPEARFPVGCEE
jgi:hypothetical protein